MKVHVAKLEKIETCGLLIERARFSREHEVVDDPAAAEMIVLTGHFRSRPHILLDNPLYRKYTDKCATYDENDHCLPLLPGVYCNAHHCESSRIGRIFSYAHITRNGVFSNPSVQYRPETEKKYFVSFQGGSTSLVRKRLYRVRFRRPDVLIENTSEYGHWSKVPAADQEERQQRYGETISASHFVLCPRGSGPSSLRLFEVMKSGVAPVLIADAYVRPPGVDWDSFLIRVKERDVSRLEKILEPELASAAERGRLARQAYLENFAEDVEFDRVIDLCARSLRHGPPTEAQFRKRQGKMLGAEKRLRARQGLMKKAALTAMRVLRIRNPYQMDVKRGAGTKP